MYKLQYRCYNDQVLFFKTKATVTWIEKIARNGKYAITLVQSIGTKVASQANYDAVIIASPLQYININFDGFPDSKFQYLPEYQTTYTNIIQGALNISYFNCLGKIPTEILTMENLNIPFSSIALKKEGNTPDSNIYKVFSREKLTSDFLTTVFINGTILREIPWKAYPMLQPTSNFPAFSLDNQGLFYVNAFESAISCMETEMISGYNIAKLTRKYLSQIN